MKNTLIIVAIALTCMLADALKAQTAAADNRLSQTVTFRAIPTGPAVLGVFEGRPPCDGIARQLNLSIPVDCPKLKWRLVLYRDPVTFQPATYTLLLSGGGDVVKQPDGSTHQQKILEGTWTTVKGMRSVPDAVVYKLTVEANAYLYLLRGDENVLFVLDENKEFRVGNESFSYTLNRVELVSGNK